MKKNKVLLCISLLLCVAAFSVFLFNLNMELNLSDFRKETEKSYAYVTNYRSLHWNNTELNMESIVQEHNSNGWHQRILFIDERIWFVYIEENTNCDKWVIASVDASGNDFVEHYSEEFERNENSLCFELDTRCTPDYYRNNSGYYLNDKIVLTNQIKLVEYDRKTKTISRATVADYDYPDCPYHFVIESNNTMRMICGNDERIITPDDLSRDSAVFAEIWKVNESMNNSNRVLYCVQYDGCDVYLICKLLNSWGESHAVVFHYNEQASAFQYVFDHYMGDLSYGKLYLVPVISS